MKRIKISISFNNYQNIDKLCLNHSSSNANNASPDEYWFSWNNFKNSSVPNKSTIFSLSQAVNGPPLIQDAFSLEYASAGGFQEIIELFPLRIFLCTHGAILAVASVDPFKSNPNEKNNYMRERLYLSVSTLCDLVSTNDLIENVNANNYIESKIRVNVDIIEEINTIETNDMINNITPEVADPPVNELSKIDDDKAENPPKSSKIISKQSKILKGDHSSIIEEEDENDKIQRHFRVTIDVKSIGGLKRPAHAFLQFTYPFLGSAAAIRTQPLWILANSESRLEGSVVTYECCMSRDRLSGIFSSHPLRIAIQSRSHLGASMLGDVVIDLNACYNLEPHSYRCPLTGRTFKSVKDYSKHRGSLIALMHAGRVDHAPPKDPIIIRASDSYCSITPSLESSESNSKPSVEGAKLRVVVIIEDLGGINSSTALSVKPGYKMHNGGLYEQQIPVKPFENNNINDIIDPINQENDINCNCKCHKKTKDEIAIILKTEREKLLIDWEGWRRSVESQWREAMQEKEISLKKKLEIESAQVLSERANALNKAQEDVSKLEIRLRGAIDNVERQKSQLLLKEEQMQIRLAQKISELQLLQRRVRDEAKSQIEDSNRKNENLLLEITSLKQSMQMFEKRAKESEKEFENYRMKMRSTPENILREETAKLKAQVSECRTEIERERRLRSECELEKEHYRSQMNRLALALKREREKSSIVARQELEQLRLEFLAREERYVLDGDREELLTLRELLDSGLYDEQADPVIIELKRSLTEAEDNLAVKYKNAN
eukprot:gene8696-11750_t